ncbi:type II toxin-antitoxin system VapB family antitoxin [Kribbella sp. NBC_01505]|uniref:type II toxin-antitoxin system VapB family antitoxin n=1 Tax=Kribbella sp. NBC_01505 TaxID=2903580 RepID=UPI00386C06B5
MSLNIKNENTHEIVRELARLTGESQTAAVDTAVRERLARVRRLRGAGLADRLLAIGADAAHRMSDEALAVEHGDLLYDENGLPK